MNKSFDAAYTPEDYVQLQHPEWAKNAAIYQVNVRAYTSEGTFAAFEKYLPRIKDLGTTILWLMPVHPIGVQHRKGRLGSPYSVKDYYAVNPEFGAIDDFKHLVDAIHNTGMYVIIDWVANHSAWDNNLVTQHPEWYTKGLDGSFEPTPWYDWEDIIDFDYDQPGLRAYMTEALKYWVRETNIDGYRCDVAGFVPLDFWNHARKELDAIKPVFMLSEWEARDLHKHAFDMSYSWTLYDCMHAVCAERKNFGNLTEYFAHDVNTFPRDGYRMLFTDNHDKNAWTSTPFTWFDKGYEACIVLTFTANGMPLIYCGQEAGNTKQLQFFDKDEIEWQPHPYFNLFKKLIALKHSNHALWNGKEGGVMERVFNNQPGKVISFSRESNGDKVIAIINFSDEALDVKPDVKYHTGLYKELFTEAKYELKDSLVMHLEAWKYAVLVREFMSNEL